MPFWRLGKKKSEKYDSLERSCNCCKEMNTISELKKPTSYYCGTKYICNKCTNIMDAYVTEYKKKYGNLSNSDMTYLSIHLPELINIMKK